MNQHPQSTAPVSAYTATHEYQSAGAVPDPCVARVRYWDGQTVSDLWTSDPMYVIVNGPISTCLLYTSPSPRDS